MKTLGGTSAPIPIPLEQTPSIGHPTLRSTKSTAISYLLDDGAHLAQMLRVVGRKLDAENLLRHVAEEGPLVRENPERVWDRQRHLIK